MSPNAVSTLRRTKTLSRILALYILALTDEAFTKKALRDEMPLRSKAIARYHKERQLYDTVAAVFPQKRHRRHYGQRQD